MQRPDFSAGPREIRAGMLYVRPMQWRGTRKSWTTWLWLLVATIAIHAILPVGSPLARSSGSPFSASTVDVSTAPSRKANALADAAAGEGSDESASGFGDDARDGPPSSSRPLVAVEPIGATLYAGGREPRSAGDLRLPQARAPPSS